VPQCVRAGEIASGIGHLSKAPHERGGEAEGRLALDATMHAQAGSCRT